MRPPRTLSELLRLSRLSLGLTLEGLAETSKVSARTISDIERGVNSAPQSRTIAALAEALGLDPEEREAFLRAAHSRRRTRSTASRASAEMPHSILDFAGRESEIAEVIAFLAVAGVRSESTALLVTGAPGIGKTASAMEALSRPHDGPADVIFVDLDGFSARPLTPLQALKAVLRQMPDVGDRVPADLEEASRLWRAASADNPRSVVLDNAVVESQVRPVLAGNPDNRIVITSRRSLAGLEGARRITLGPLSEPESVRLLERLIPEHQRQVGDLVELARLSDRIPLALRIVGNRIASRPRWQASHFAERMRSAEDRLRLLVAGDLAVEAAFALSYDDLDVPTAHLFRSISVIDGSTFDARLAAAAAGIDVIDADDLLEALTDLGLLESRGGSRYRMHDLVKLFALARLERESDLKGQAERDRLRLWLLASLERAGAWFEPGREPQTHAAFGAAFPDAATAQEWIRSEEPHWWPALRSGAIGGEHTVVVDVADSLHWFSELWIEWGHWRELFALAVASAQALADSRLEAMHLGYLVWATVVETGDDSEGVRLAELGVAAAIASDDPCQLGWEKFYAAWLYYRVGRVQESAVLALESVAHFESIDDHDSAAHPITLLARLPNDRTGHERMIAALLHIASRMDEGRPENFAIVRKATMLVVYKFLSVSYMAVDRLPEALEAASSAVEIAQEFGAGIRVAGALRHRAIVQLALEEFEAADSDIADALGHIDPESKHAVVVREREVIVFLGEQSTHRIARPVIEPPQ